LTNEVSFLFEKMCQVMLSDPKLLNSAALRDKIDRAVTIEMLETNIGGGGDFFFTKGRVLIVDD
jgi:CheY-like chemotaxis protein